MSRSPFPLELADARGRTLRLDAPPRQIVSLVPSQTELLAHLDLADETVGLTRFCERPADWKDQKEIVGGTKNVRVEKVRALQPDLVLANIEENTREVVEAVEAFAPVFVTDVKTVDDASAMIRDVGRLTNRADAAATLADGLHRRFAALTGDLAGTPPLPVAYLIWRDPYMTIGHGTIIHDVLARAGLRNVFGGRTRYPEVTAAEIAASGARAVLLPDEPFPFDDEYAAELREALAAETAAEADGAPPLPTRLVDGQLFSWYGPRLAEAPSYLRRLRTDLATAGQEAP